jgi:hypothetical protein
MNQNIDGVWDSTLTYIQAPGLRGGWPPERLSLDIRGDVVKVYRTTEEKGRIEVKPGRFRLDRYMTNIVIFATDSGTDTDGTWVETEVFILTEKGSETFGATFTGAVNNINLSPASEISKFFYVGTGDFTRISG